MSTHARTMNPVEMVFLLTSLQRIAPVSVDWFVVVIAINHTIQLHLNDAAPLGEDSRMDRLSILLERVIGASYPAPRVIINGSTHTKAIGTGSPWL